MSKLTYAAFRESLRGEVQVVLDGLAPRAIRRRIFTYYRDSREIEHLDKRNPIVYVIDDRSRSIVVVAYRKRENGTTAPVHLKVFPRGPGAVMVLPYTTDGLWIVILEHRPAIGAWVISLPIESIEISDPKRFKPNVQEIREAIWRALQEEAGCEPTEETSLDLQEHQEQAGLIAGTTFMVLAQNLNYTGKNDLQADEEIEVRPCTSQELLELIRCGRGFGTDPNHEDRRVFLPANSALVAMAMAIKAMANRPYRTLRELRQIKSTVPVPVISSQLAQAVALAPSEPSLD